MTNRRVVKLRDSACFCPLHQSYFHKVILRKLEWASLQFHAMKTNAMLLAILLFGMSLAGCVSQNSDISEENDTTVIIDNSIVVEPSPVDDVTTNASATGGGASNVTYAGFLDNSSINGFRINPISNFSRIYITLSEYNCTTTDNGGDDWNGTSWEDPICVKDLGQEGLSFTHQNGELCGSDGTDNYCWNMTTSNRTMWLQGDIWGGQEEICYVYIQSERFIPSSNYNLTHRAYDANGQYIYPDWDALFNDPAYIVWEQERMDAYNSELDSVPDWCTDPMFGLEGAE